MHSPTRKCFISRTYLTLSELRDEWNTTDEHIRYLIENRKLRAYLRPALVFYTNNNVDYLNDYDPLPISHPDLCRLLRDREACIQIIEAHFNARYDDIVIKDSDRCMVEEEYPHLISSGIWPLVLYSENWTCFEYKKRRYTFGHTQGAVLKYLYQQLRSGKPLVGTKELLNAVNAHCHHIANLFNHKPEWKNLIIFPERGYCRLNMPDKIIAQKYQPSLFDNIDEENNRLTDFLLSHTIHKIQGIACLTFSEINRVFFVITSPYAPNRFNTNQMEQMRCMTIKSHHETNY